MSKLQKKPAAHKRGHPTLQNMNVIFALLDPDPDFGSGSTGPIESGSNPDPGPQPWFREDLVGGERGGEEPERAVVLYNVPAVVVRLPKGNPDVVVLHERHPHAANCAHATHKRRTRDKISIKQSSASVTFFRYGYGSCYFLS